MIRRRARTESHACEDCKLHTTRTNIVMGDGNVNKPIIVFVGEAPGENEDLQGKPFIGKSGSYLRQMVSAFGLTDYAYFTNVVKCRPPNNKKPNKSSISSCLPKLLAELRYMNPDILVLLGATAIKSVATASGTVAQYSNQFISTEYCDNTFLMYHPSYIIRTGSFDIFEDGFKLLVLKMWELGIEVSPIVEVDGKLSKPVPMPENIHIVDTVDKLYELCDRLKEYDGIVAWDTESNNNKPFRGDKKRKLLYISMCWDPKEAWVIPIHHGDRCLGDAALNELKPWFEDSNKRKICHNAKYDALVMLVQGIHVKGIVRDTMVMSHLGDVYRPEGHGLKGLASSKLSWVNYDGDMMEYQRHHKECKPKSTDESVGYQHFPPELIQEYAGLDAAATLQLYYILLEELTDKQVILLDELLIPASELLTYMEYTGTAVDLDRVDEYIHAYEDTLERVIEDLANLPTVGKYLSDVGKETFNPNSYKQMGAIIYDYFDFEVTVRTDSGNPSTNSDDVLAHILDGSMKSKNPNVCNEPVEFVRLAMLYRKATKMLGTYLRSSSRGGKSLDDDNKIRSTFNLHGTVSGRLSSSDPNLQNIPALEAIDDPEHIMRTHPIKNIYCSRWMDKGMIMEVDFSAMELRVMSSLAGCKEMIDAFSHGRDIHRLVAGQVHHKDPDDITKEERYSGKWANWTLLYGGGVGTLVSLYGLSYEEAEKVVDGYYRIFPEVKWWQDSSKKSIVNNRYVESIWGRRQYLDRLFKRAEGNDSYRASIVRSAINAQIQGPASDVLLAAGIIVHDLLEQEGYTAYIVDVVHDSLIIDVIDEHVRPVAILVKDVMENIVQWGKMYFPRLDWDWLTCPLEATPEVGRHWGEKKELKL